MAPSAMGRRIKRLREAKGLSQRSLAAEATLTQGLIHQLETGKVQDVRSQAVVRIARALGVSVTRLLA